MRMSGKKWPSCPSASLRRYVSQGGWALTKDEEQVGKNRAKQRSLHDSELALEQRDDSHDQLDRVSERSVDESTKRLSDS